MRLEPGVNLLHRLQILRCVRDEYAGLLLRDEPEMAALAGYERAKPIDFDARPFG